MGCRYNSVSLRNKEYTMTNAIYEDDEKLASILEVLKAAELFGEVIQVKMLQSDEELEVEEWEDVLAKTGKDEVAYLFENYHHEYSMGTIEIETEPKVSGHDWIESVTLSLQPRSVTTIITKSECGKQLTECYSFDCKHEVVSYQHSTEPNERNEYKTDWNSMADRPSPDFMMGMPGLRYIEIDQEFFTRLNIVCSECHLYTPKKDTLCQNCDKVLVLA